MVPLSLTQQGTKLLAYSYLARLVLVLLLVLVLVATTGRRSKPPWLPSALALLIAFLIPLLLGLLLVALPAATLPSASSSRLNPFELVKALFQAGDDLKLPLGASELPGLQRISKVRELPGAAEAASM